MDIDPVTMDLITKLATVLVLGGLGGLLRGGLGIVKARKEAETWKDVNLDWILLGLSTGISAMVGIVVFLLLDTSDPKVILPFGYAGTDALEGLLGERVKRLKAKTAR